MAGAGASGRGLRGPPDAASLIKRVGPLLGLELLDTLLSGGRDGERREVPSHGDVGQGTVAGPVVTASSSSSPKIGALRRWPGRS